MWNLRSFQGVIQCFYQLWRPLEHKAVPAPVQAPLGPHHPVPEGLRDEQAQLHAPALHQQASGHGAQRQPHSGPQLQERRVQSGINRQTFYLFYLLFVFIPSLLNDSAFTAASCFLFHSLQVYEGLKPSDKFEKTLDYRLALLDF